MKRSSKVMAVGMLTAAGALATVGVANAGDYSGGSDHHDSGDCDHGHHHHHGHHHGHHGHHGWGHHRDNHRDWLLGGLLNGGF